MFLLWINKSKGMVPNQSIQLSYFNHHLPEISYTKDESVSATQGLQT
jgi:hypothetical protein